MKKLYEELELEIIRFGAADIITASDAADDAGTDTDDTSDTDDATDDTNDNTGTTAMFDYGSGAVEETHTLTPTGEYIDSVIPIYVDEVGNQWVLDGDAYHLVSS